MTPKVCCRIDARSIAWNHQGDQVVRAESQLDAVVEVEREKQPGSHFIIATQGHHDSSIKTMKSRGCNQCLKKAW